MAKKKRTSKTPHVNTKKKFMELNSRLDKYTDAVGSLYDALQNETAMIAASTAYGLDASGPFRFADFPAASQAFQKVMATYLADLSFIVDRGTKQEWERSESDHDQFVMDVLKKYNAEPTQEEYSGYLTHRADARDAFLEQQRTGTHGWSNRVWNLSAQTQQEMELAVSASFADGTSADDLSRSMKKYLNEPDRLFRRVRNEYGQLVLSKNAAAYHPGPGIYRSSKKNAMRLCRTEINMAYRNADHQRYQHEDFVVGYEIKLSGSHPMPDICDTLAGKYPKDFQWNGWHPQDLCYIVPILKTEDEFFNADADAPSVNEVTAPPAAYDQYMEDNAERLEAARQRGTLPYWVKDNYHISRNGIYRPLFGTGTGTIKNGKIVADAGTTQAIRVNQPKDYIAVDLPYCPIGPLPFKIGSGVTPESNYVIFKELSAAAEYKDAQYYANTGGVYATHIMHGHKDITASGLFFVGKYGPNGRGLYGDELEELCAKKLASEGHCVVLRSESTGLRPGTTNDKTSLDMNLDGRIVEIRSITGETTNIRNSIKVKNDQLRDFLKDEGIKADTICLFFQDASYYEDQKIRDGIINFKRLFGKNHADKVLAKKILCVFGDSKPSLIFNI